MNIFLLCSAVCMLCLFSCSHDNSTPQSKQNNKDTVLDIFHYTSKRGNYSVDIPKRFFGLQEDSSIIRIDDRLSARTFTSMTELGNTALIISAVHYPEARFALNTNDELLEQTGKEFLRSLQARSIRYSPDGASGLDIYYTTQDSTTSYHGHTRLFARRPTIYNSTIITTDSVLFFQKDIVHFFTSLHPLY